MTEPTTAPTTTAKSRIFLVDDHEMFREGLRQLIEREPDMTVCGDAADAAAALTGIEATSPDLVIVDLSLGGTSGIELIKSVKSRYEDLPVLVVSMHEESLYSERALRAGAMGYVMKHEPSKTVKTAIRKVMEGDLFLSPKMAGSMVAKLMHGSSEQFSSPLESLSDRELEVFRMLGQGKPVRLIAEAMNVTVPTVNSFRNRIKEKLNLKSSTEVMLQAIQWVQDQKPM
jgi:DNA-binding NarL/FixJ family response regulator